MSSWEEELISATTESVTSEAFNVVGTVVVVAAGFGEEISEEGAGVQFYHDGNWYTLYLNGILQQITKKHSMITLSSPGKYRVVKTETAAEVSVFIWKSEAVT